MILLGIFIWALWTGHPWIASLLFVRFMFRFVLALLSVAAK